MDLVNGQLHCVVVTPEQTVYASDASFVTVTLFDGELGIAPGHAPLIGRLGFGELRVTHPGESSSQVDHYYVEGGFVEVSTNVVTVLTGFAVKRADLNSADAQKKIDAAKSGTIADKGARDLALQQGKSRLRMAGQNVGHSSTH
jgi:F-type H+-transporting ATPase subunit epsilon